MKMLFRNENGTVKPVPCLIMTKLVGGGGGTSGILDHPTYSQPKTPPSMVKKYKPVDGLSHDYEWRVE